MAYGQQDLVAVVIYPDTAHPHTQHCHGPAWLPSSYRLLGGRFRGRNRMQVKGGSPEMGTRSIQDCLPEDVLGTRPLPCLAWHPMHSRMSYIVARTEATWRVATGGR